MAGESVNVVSSRSYITSRRQKKIPHRTTKLELLAAGAKLHRRDSRIASWGERRTVVSRIGSVLRLALAGDTMLLNEFSHKLAEAYCPEVKPLKVFGPVEPSSIDKVGSPHLASIVFDL